MIPIGSIPHGHHAALLIDIQINLVVNLEESSDQGFDFLAIHIGRVCIHNIEENGHHGRACPPANFSSVSKGPPNESTIIRPFGQLIDAAHGKGFVAEGELKIGVEVGLDANSSLAIPNRMKSIRVAGIFHTGEQALQGDPRDFMAPLIDALKIGFKPCFAICFSAPAAIAYSAEGRFVGADSLEQRGLKEA